jgi:hypothetical protein
MPPVNKVPEPSRVIPPERSTPAVDWALFVELSARLLEAEDPAERALLRETLVRLTVRD